MLKFKRKFGRLKVKWFLRCSAEGIGDFEKPFNLSIITSCEAHYSLCLAAVYKDISRLHIKHYRVSSWFSIRYTIYSFVSQGATQPIVSVYFTVLYRALASSRSRLLDHTQRRATVSRTPLNEWSVRRRDLYLTTHNTHNRLTSMPWVGFEPMIAQASGHRPMP